LPILRSPISSSRGGVVGEPDYVDSPSAVPAPLAVPSALQKNKDTTSQQQQDKPSVVLPSIVIHSTHDSIQSTSSNVNVYPTVLRPPPPPPSAAPASMPFASSSSASSSPAISTRSRPPQAAAAATASGGGRSLTHQLPLSRPQPKLHIVPCSIPSHHSDGGVAPLKSAVAEAGFIPIGFGSTQPRLAGMGTRQPARIETSGLPPASSSSVSGGDLSSSSSSCSCESACSGDDGFTPVTPGMGLHSAVAAPGTVSPTSRAGGAAGLSPRDALGIPLSKILRYASFRSQQRQGREEQPPPLPRLAVAENKGADHDEYYEDVTPLSPRTPLSARIRFGLGNFGGGGAPQGDLEKGLAVKPQKSVRQTLFGLVEGWWELGLLERGKSLKRNGGGGAQR